MPPKRRSSRVSLAAQLLAHVEVCDERYSNIEKQMVVVDRRMGRVEKVMMSVAGSTILLLIGGLWFFVQRGIH